MGGKKARASKANSSPRLIFKNACGHPELDHAGTDSDWARLCMNSLGFDAYIGTSVQVLDTSARKFTEAFYDSLLGGYALADAFMIAQRTLLRGKKPDPHALAYHCYADPDIRVLVPSQTR